MARPKLPRKSTAIDMTAMCDVAFLLLSFFILTTKFKPSEAVSVQTPSSVASKVAPEKDVVMVSVTHDGKVFINMDNEEIKGEIANTLNTTKGLNLNVKAFQKAEFFGTSFGQLPAFLALPNEQKNDRLLPGIPCKDSANNELTAWMQIIKDAYLGKKMNLLFKGDNVAKYTVFKNILDAFKKNDLLKFQMVTNPEGVPTGTDLWKDNQKGGGAAADANKEE
jgi:biopolymer transport protein ExbD